jgi:predicted RNA-binding protein with PUA-like domain
MPQPDTPTRQYWLLKSEPSVFSIDDLQRVQTTIWDGIRNYQARNYLRTAHPGDLAFFYHSSNASTGLAGLCEIVETDVVDPTQFDPVSAYYDAKSTPANPRWYTVKVRFVEKFAQITTLETLKAQFTPEELVVVRKGYRLSVMPVSAEVAPRLFALAQRKM